MNIVTLHDEEPFGNTYVVGEEGGPCVLIDFCDNRDNRLLRYVERHHSKLLGVLLTHGHIDHFYGLLDAETPLPCPLFLHPEDWPCLEDDRMNASRMLGNPISYEYPGKIEALVDGQTLSLGEGFDFKVIATPFHTKGSVCFYLESADALFTGDTLFKGSVGRTDLVNSCPRKMQDSLRKIMKLKEFTTIYPGHDRKSTIAWEKRTNSFLIGLQ